MMRYVFYFSVLFCLLLMSGCSSGSSDAPASNAAHPDNWIALHGDAADADLRGCQGCHGFDFNGSGDAVSCYSCHISGPPFSLHPVSWTDVVADHQAFADDLSWTSCAVGICHGTDLQAGNGPTCFNGACHVNTGGDPVPASHQGVNFIDPNEHGSPAKASQFYCLNCHGRPATIVDGGYISDPDIMNNLDFNGAAVFGNCTICHPDAGAHPTNWQGSNDSTPAYISSHRTIDTDTVNQSCALCHSIAGPGIGAVPSAPSCFSADHTNSNSITTNCHPNGPRVAPHATDGSYRVGGDVNDPNNPGHGWDAKQDLKECQQCHADNTIAGPGDNPRFNAPIGNLVNGCEDCHAANYAHPSSWAGPNTRFHYSAGNIANACTLCHGATLNGVGGVGLSCLGCHAETTTFTLDCTACHNYPPLVGDTIDASIFPPGATLVDHTATNTGGNVADKPEHDECAVCHGVKNAAGSLDASGNYLIFNKTTDTIGSHWNGSINMNGPSSSDPAGVASHVGAGYNSTNWGCDNAGCHGPAPGFALSDSNMSVEFADFGGGSGHPVGQSWLLRTGHVAAVSNACFSCHALSGASPVPAAPACQDCHVNGDPLVVLNCASCHTEPPSFASTNTADRPDRAGIHSKHDALTADTLDCSACHTNGGTNSLTHYDRIDSTTPDYPADVEFLVNGYDSQGSTAAYNTGTATCQNVICHGGVTAPNWYTGSIDVNTQCSSCHVQGSSEYNSWNSGKHDKHVNGEGADCVDCHSVSALATGSGSDWHFSNLKTPAFELSPGLTIGGSDTIVGNTWNNSNNTCSTLDCHGENHSSGMTW